MIFKELDFWLQLEFEPHGGFCGLLWGHEGKRPLNNDFAFPLLKIVIIIIGVISSFLHSPKANRTNPLVLLNLLVITPNIF
jgi:hypothetical protein